MNKDELESAFNETTNSAVDLLKENVELKKKCEVMKENTYILQQRIDKAIEHIECNAFYIDSYYGEDLKLVEVNKRYYNELLEILKGSDKE